MARGKVGGEGEGPRGRSRGPPVKPVLKRPTSGGKAVFVKPAPPATAKASSAAASAEAVTKKPSGPVAATVRHTFPSAAKKYDALLGAASRTAGISTKSAARVNSRARAAIAVAGADATSPVRKGRRGGKIIVPASRLSPKKAAADDREKADDMLSVISAKIKGLQGGRKSGKRTKIITGGGKTKSRKSRGAFIRIDGAEAWYDGPDAADFDIITESTFLEGRCERGSDATFVMQVAAPHDRDRGGCFCEGEYLGSSSAAVDTAVDACRTPPLWHFCAGPLEECKAHSGEGGRPVVHVDAWRRMPATYRAKSWLRVLPEDDDGDDGYDGRRRQGGGILDLAKPSGFDKKAEGGGPQSLDELRMKLQRAKSEFTARKNADKKPARGSNDRSSRSSGPRVAYGDEAGVSSAAELLSQRVKDFGSALAAGGLQRERGRSRKRRRDESSGSESGDSRGHGNSSSQLFGLARGTKDGASLRTLVRRYPGQLLSNMIDQMQLCLGDRRGTDGGPDRLSPLCVAYVTSILQPTLGEDAGGRAGDELRTLAHVMDLILKGNLPEAMDILAGRFSAVETYATTKDWGSAKHLQVVAPSTVTCVNPALQDFAQRRKKEEAKRIG